VNLGAIALAPHQQHAVTALLPLLTQHGVALLADATGLGKTFTALAVAARYGGAQVVAPAAVVDAWRTAADRCGVRVSVHSSAQLSRRAVGASSHALVIIDEAHAFRNAATRRWRHAARLCRGRPLLACTATPIHNARHEVVTILRLAAGARAAQWSDAEVQAVTVRRTADELDAAAHLPTVAPWEWWTIPDHAAVAAAIHALPSALPLGEAASRRPADILWRFGLVRAWASSVAALRVAVTQRLAAAEAMRALLLEGRRPTRAVLRRWVGAEATIQAELPFADDRLTAELVDATDAATWADVVVRHAEGLRALLHHSRTDTSDADRCQRVWQFVAQSTAPTLLFTHARATAAMYWRALRQHPGVALLTASGGEIASGRVSRAELLRWLDPVRAGTAARDPTRVLRLLIATDLASEGVNLHRAAQVVHADLPWTPARIAQRIGRVARLGAAHTQVTVAAFAPPATGDNTLHLTARLHRKREDAARVMVDADVAALRRRVRHPPVGGPVRIAGLPVYRVASTPSGYEAAVVALVRTPDALVVYGETTDAATPRWAPLTAQQVADRLGGDGPPFVWSAREWSDVERRRLASRLRTLRRTLADADALAAVTGGRSTTQQPWLARASTALRDVPRHQQVAARTLVQELRARLTLPLPADVERVLDLAVRSRARGLAWLTRAVRIVRTAPPPPAARAPTASGRRVVALWVVEAEAAAGG
jgi:superfamily II DNA or RNA helicase